MIKDLIKYPLQPFNGYQKVFDADGNLLLDIRGWGRLEKQLGAKDAIQAQDDITKFVIEAINEKLERENG